MEGRAAKRGLPAESVGLDAPAQKGEARSDMRGTIGAVFRRQRPRLAILQSQGDIRPVKRVLRDIQFWIPVLVLIGGLLVLQWIR